MFAFAMEFKTDDIRQDTSRSVEYKNIKSKKRREQIKNVGDKRLKKEPERQFLLTARLMTSPAIIQCGQLLVFVLNEAEGKKREIKKLFKCSGSFT